MNQSQKAKLFVLNLEPPAVVLIRRNQPGRMNAIAFICIYNIVVKSLLHLFFIYSTQVISRRRRKQIDHFIGIG